LPQVAQEQSPTVYHAVKECFDAYDREVSRRINGDITDRQSELDNLLKQKQTQEINRDAESQRLQSLQDDVAYELKTIESIYNNLLADYS